MSSGYCYVAKAPGIPGAYAACADMILTLPRETASFIAKEQRRGAIVERVPSQTARELMGEFLKWQSAETKRTGKHPKLFVKKKVKSDD